MWQLILFACSPSLLLVDSNMFQEKMIKNKEEALILECSIVILKAGKKRPQLSLVDNQGAPTSSSGNGSKVVTKPRMKATSKLVT
jgi:hypothetical protein